MFGTPPSPSILDLDDERSIVMAIVITTYCEPVVVIFYHH